MAGEAGGGATPRAAAALESLAREAGEMLRRREAGSAREGGAGPPLAQQPLEDAGELEEKAEAAEVVEAVEAVVVEVAVAVETDADAGAGSEGGLHPQVEAEAEADDSVPVVAGAHIWPGDRLVGPGPLSPSDSGGSAGTEGGGGNSLSVLSSLESVPHASIDASATLASAEEGPEDGSVVASEAGSEKGSEAAGEATLLRGRLGDPVGLGFEFSLDLGGLGGVSPPDQANLAPRGLVGTLRYQPDCEDPSPEKVPLAGAAAAIPLLSGEEDGGKVGDLALPTTAPVAELELDGNSIMFSSAQNVIPLHVEHLRDAKGGTAWYTELPLQAEESLALPSKEVAVYPPDALLGWGVPGQGFLAQPAAFGSSLAPEILVRETGASDDTRGDGAEEEEWGKDLAGNAAFDVLVAPPADAKTPSEEEDRNSSDAIHERLDRLEMLVDSQDGQTAGPEVHGEGHPTAAATDGELSGGNTSVKEEVCRLAEQIRALSVDLDDVRRSFQIQQRELGDSQAQQAAAEEKLKEALTRGSSLEQAAEALSGRLAHTSAEADALRAQLSEEKDHAARLEARVSAEGEVLESMMQRIKGLEEELKQSRREASELNLENERMEGAAERAVKGSAESASLAEGKQKQLNVLTEKLEMVETDALKKMSLLRTLTNDNQSLNQLLREARGDISALEREKEKLHGHMNHLRGELEHVHKLYSNMEQAALTFQESPPYSARGPAPPSQMPSLAAEGHLSSMGGGVETFPPRPATANPLQRPTRDILPWGSVPQARPRTSGLPSDSSGPFGQPEEVQMPPTPPQPGTAAAGRPMPAKADPDPSAIPAAGAPSQKRALGSSEAATELPVPGRGARGSAKPYATQQDVEQYIRKVAGTEKRLMHLSMEKQQLESEYSKMGITFGRTIKERRRRAELEQRLDQIDREASSCRFALKSLHAMS